jgi:hypothetical protein
MKIQDNLVETALETLGARLLNGWELRLRLSLLRKFKGGIPSGKSGYGG